MASTPLRVNYQTGDADPAGAVNATNVRVNQIDPLVDYNRLLEAVPYVALNGTPSIDAAPALQALIDAGYWSIDLKGRCILLSSSVFFDPAGVDGLNACLRISGGKVFLNPATLPTIDGTAYRTAIHVGTKRTALSGGNITVNDANKSWYDVAGDNSGNASAIHVEGGTWTVLPFTDAYLNARTYVAYANVGGTSSNNLNVVGISGFWWTGYADQHTHTHITGDQAKNVSPVRAVNVTATGGTFTFSATRNSVTQTTTAIAWNASTATFETALAALTNVTGAKVYGSPGAYKVVLPQSGVTSSINTASLTGGSATLVAEPVEASLVRQTDFGDGVIITSPKSSSGTTSRTLLVNATNNRGLRVSGPVTGGMRFDTCQGVSIVAAHQEANINSDLENIVSVESGITSRDGVYYSRRDPGGVFVIRDNAQTTTVDQGSTLKSVDDIQYRRMLNSYDAAHGPLVQLAQQNDMSSITFRGLRAVEVTDAAPGVARPSFLYPITADNVTVQQVIDADATKPIIASGSFKLQRFGGWEVTNLDDKQQYTSPVMTGAHTITALAGSPTGGTLVNGTTYHYAVAVVSSIIPTLRTTACAVTSVAATSNGSIKLRLANPESNIIRIWRKAGSAATTAPTQYVELYAPQTGRLFTWDMGSYIAGRPWQTYVAGTHPAPPTTPTATVAETILDGAVI